MTFLTPMSLDDKVRWMMFRASEGGSRTKL